MEQKRNKIFWRTGQEITPDTFILADNYICSQHNLIRRLIAGKSYGVLPETEGTESSSGGEKGGSSFAVKSKLNKRDIYIDKVVCCGTTNAGYLIEIDDRLWDSFPQKHLSIPDSEAKALYVVVRVNPFEQVLIEPVVNEEAPTAHAVFELNVRELNRIGEDELAIIKINNCSYEPEINTEYIPPCMSVNACSNLLDIYGQLKKLLSEMIKHIEKKDELFGSTLYPLTMLHVELYEFSLSSPPIELIRLMKKIMQTSRFFVPDVKTVDMPDFLRTYNHNDMSITFKALLSYLQAVIRVVSEGIEEDFTPRI